MDLVEGFETVLAFYQSSSSALSQDTEACSAASSTLSEGPVSEEVDELQY